jgi:glyoxylase-like metal-dependent hydrolase (beta-lactamase superfamily II)
MNPFRVAENTFALDPLVFGLEGFTSVYVLAGKTLALVDSGSPKSTTTIIDGIRACGYDPKDVSKIILSHIHFDHGSGAGALLPHFPQAMVYVHENGHKHLTDPSRLTKSAKKVFGSLIDEWYGDFRRVPAERVVILRDGDRIDLGGERILTVIETPGHAKHQLCIYDPVLGGIFTGDEAGVYFPEIDAIIPTSPPPDFDPDVNTRSVRRLLDLNPERVLFAHYLTAPSAMDVLRRYIGVVEDWKKIVAEGMDRELDFEGIVQLIRTEAYKTLKPLEQRKNLFSWIFNHHIPMCVKGYVHYFKKNVFI